MTRLALAKTLVSGTVTLQGIVYSFTASASGTAKADRVPEAKKIAVEASNTAATLAARASIDKIILNNSAVLSDLEITSLISNNFTTTVVAFKPIALESIATTTDGIKYTLNPNVTIGSGQWLTVPSGKTLSSTADNPLINKGYIQYGDTTSKSSSALKSTNCSSGTLTNSGTLEITSGECYTVDSGTDNNNSGTITIDSGGCFTINAGYTLYNNGSFTNSGATTNNGNFNNSNTTVNNGTFTNSGNDYSTIYNGEGSFTNSTSGIITNGGYNSNFRNVCNITFINDGLINNIGEYSYSCEPSSSSGGCSGTCNKPCVPPPT